MAPPPAGRPAVNAYLWAFFAFVAAAGLRWLLMPLLGTELPFVTLFFAVFVGAWVGGMGPALLATALSLVFTLLVLTPGTLDPAMIAGLAIFALTGVAVGVLGQGRLNGLRKADEATRAALEEREKAEEAAALAEEEAARAEEESARAEEEAARAVAAGAATAAQSDRLNKILASISDAFSVVGHDWTILYANEQAAAITGRSVEELVGRNVWQLFPEAVGGPFDLAYRRALSTQTVIRVESYYQPLDKHIRATIYPGAEGLTVLSQDVTEQRRMEIALQESSEELEASNEELKAALDDLADRTAVAEASEHRLAMILESIGDGFYSLDREWRFVFVNRRAAEAMKRPREEIVGRTIWELFPQIRGTAWAEALERAMAQGESVVIEEKSVLNESWMSLRVYPTADGLSVFFEDVTRARLAAEALKASEERLRLAMDVGRIGIWDWDIANNVVTWTDKVYEFHGLRKGEFGGRVEDFQTLVHPEDLNRVGEAIQEALRTGNDYHAEFRVVHPGGEVRWLVTDGRVVKSEAGAPVRMLGATQDVTQRRDHDERLRQMQRIEAAGRIAGGVAHEVNNQMTVVLGLAEFMLRSPALTPELHADAVQIKRAGERSAAITAQLLAFSRRQVLWPVLVDLNQIIRDFERVLRKTAGESTTLVLRLAPDLPRVLADRAQVEQVLLNLTLNAADAMKSGGGQLTIETATRAFSPEYAAAKPAVSLTLGEYVVITVSDNGHGMTREVLDHVFEPFYTTKPLGHGSGLGLSSVYGIVKQSNGYIWAYSEPGNGSVFKIYLPVPAEAGNGHEPRESQAIAVGGSETILVVEDEPDLRSLFARMLRELGYRPVEAANGEVALQVIRKGEPAVDLVLTDIAMPGMTGRDLGKVLDAEFPDMPVLYMSGYTDSDIVARGLLEKDVPFIQKPFSPDVIARHLRQVLDGRRGPAVA